MTELETYLLSALQDLHKEFEKQHAEYMKSAEALQTMFDNTRQKNEEIESLLKHLTTQLKGS